MAIVAVRAFRGTRGQPCVPQIAWYLLVEWHSIPSGIPSGIRSWTVSSVKAHAPEIDGYYAHELRFDGKYGWWPDDWIDRPWPMLPSPPIPKGESETILG